jgi:S1-C subfamily serine protease
MTTRDTAGTTSDVAGDEAVAVALSSHLADLAARAERSVVRVDGRRAPASGLVWADGVVVTAHHNLERDDVEVGLPDGRTVRAEVAGRDPATDLAALRTDTGGAPAPAWGEAAALRAGQVLVGVTRPGRAPRASVGVLARVADEWRAPTGGKLDRFLEIDLALHPGFSGGLAVDVAGRAAGMLSAGLLRGSPLVVARPTLERVVSQLLARGGIRRGYLGVATFPVRIPGALAQRIGQDGALLVSAVEPGSPAERAGLLLGDAILSLGGQAVASAGDLMPLLDEDRIGRALPVRLLRAGDVREIPVEVGARGGGR